MADKTSAPVYEIGFVSPMNFGSFCMQIFSPVKLDRGTKLCSRAAIDDLARQLSHYKMAAEAEADLADKRGGELRKIKCARGNDQLKAYIEKHGAPVPMAMELESAKASLVLAADEILKLRAALLHVDALGVYDSSGIDGIVSGKWNIASAADRISDILSDLSNVADSWVVEATGATADAQNQCAMQMLEAIERWSNKLALFDASSAEVTDGTP